VSARLWAAVPPLLAGAVFLFAAFADVLPTSVLAAVALLVGVPAVVWVVVFLFRLGRELDREAGVRS
jgi:ABC-type phosphate transport system permease subunit